MKKLFFTFCMVFLAASFANQLQAQTNSCTTAQKAACKKICSTTTASKCTPAQMAACKKVCSSSASKVASTTNKDASFASFVNNSDAKKPMGCSAAKSVRLTNNETPSCMTKKAKVANNEKSTQEPIAQKVAMKTIKSNE